jgi:glycosyltransferase involved in cell wall biosynthesis
LVIVKHKPLFRSTLARLFDLVAGGSGLFHPVGSYGRQLPRRAMVLTPGVIPTTEIYLKGRIEKQFSGAVRYVDTTITSPKAIELEEDTLVVVVRHAPLRWLRWLKRMDHRFAQVAFLMDDDMPLALQAPELPLPYALKTAWRFAITKRFLSARCRQVWLSTRELARRYPQSAAQVWEPGYLPELSNARSSAAYFYHGTWAHRQEIEWLVPIVKAVQRALPEAWFEIMGGDKVRRLFRGIPRVRVVHPMPWQDYRRYARTSTLQVGLAPCLDTPFNRGRSHVKVFDITRLGAAGVYSNGTPYAEKVSHGRTGLLCKNDPAVWAAAIVLLLENEELRKTIWQGAQSWCEGQP